MLSETEAAFVEVLILEEGISSLQLLPLICQRGDQTLPDAVKQAHFMPAPRVGHAFKRAKDLLSAAGPAPHALSVGTVIGGFQLKQPVGEGPSGTLWQALRQGQPQLLRLLPPNGAGDPARATRFVERSNAGLPPPAPNLLRIDDAGEDEGWLFACTGGVQAQSLARALTTSAPLPEASALKCAFGVAQALQVAHSLGVVHGGLSPLAVLIGPSGEVQLSDFGVSAAILDAPVACQRPGRRAGLLLYASPDLVGGDVGRGLLGTDDLYALGTLLYHMVTPAHAAPAKDKPWPLEPPVSAGLREVLGRLLDGRYGKIEQVLADLGRVGQGLGPGEPPQDLAPIKGRRYDSAESQFSAAPPPQEPPSTARRAARPLADTASDMDALPAHESCPPRGADLERTSSGRIRPRARSARASGSRQAPSERLRQEPRSGSRRAPRNVGRRQGRAPEPWPGRVPRRAGARGRRRGRVVDRRAAAPAAQAPLERALREAQDPQPNYALAFGAISPLLDRCRDRGGGGPRRAPPPGAGRGRRRARRRPRRAARCRRLGALPAATRLELDLAQGLGAAGQLARPRRAPVRHPQGDAAAAAEAYRLAKLSVPAPVAWASEQAFLPELALPEGGTTPAGYLGAREVSRAEFRAWAQKAKVEPPSDWALSEDALPATGVSHEQALAYAASLAEGAGLPPLAVLQAAVGGGEGRRFPWGALAPSPLLVNAEGAYPGLLPSGSLVAGVSYHGAYDLLGNAPEHTAQGEVSFGGDPQTGYDALLEPRPAGTDLGFRVWLPLEAPRAQAGKD
ncbi:MAG: SUMF1/EgtB/PvdO family nonheme iron enzyme [Planctomycetota bacterium]